MRSDAITAIKRGSGTPLHHQVFLVMRSSILSGRYDDGEMLPSEDDLARLFGVSRVTIRNALGALQRDELVEKRQGVGTFVTRRRVLESLRAPNAELIDHIRLVGASTQVRVLDVERVRAPSHLQDFFRCEPDAWLHRATRLRLIGLRPVFHVEAYLPDSIGADLTRAELGRDSLHQLLARRGVELCSGRQVISAVLAEPGIAHHLGTEVGAALLRIRRFHYDQHGLPVEYMELLASPHAFEVETMLEAADI